MAALHWPANSVASSRSSSWKMRSPTRVSVMAPATFSRTSSGTHSSADCSTGVPGTWTARGSSRALLTISPLPVSATLPVTPCADRQADGHDLVAEVLHVAGRRHEHVLRLVEQEHRALVHLDDLAGLARDGVEDLVQLERGHHRIAHGEQRGELLLLRFLPAQPLAQRLERRGRARGQPQQPGLHSVGPLERDPGAEELHPRHAGQGHAADLERAGAVVHRLEPPGQVLAAFGSQQVRQRPALERRRSTVPVSCSKAALQAVIRRSRSPAIIGMGTESSKALSACSSPGMVRGAVREHPGAASCSTIRATASSPRPRRRQRRTARVMTARNRR